MKHLLSLRLFFSLRNETITTRLGRRVSLEVLSAVFSEHQREKMRKKNSVKTFCEKNNLWGEKLHFFVKFCANFFPEFRENCFPETKIDLCSHVSFQLIIRRESLLGKDKWFYSVSNQLLLEIRPCHPCNPVSAMLLLWLGNKNRVIPTTAQKL